MKKLPGVIEKESLVILARQLALIFDSEISIHEGLTLIQTKSDNQDLIRIMEDAIASIDAGDHLNEALKKHEKSLTPFFVNMIEIGEKSGNLVNVLEQIADSYEKEIETREKVKSAVSYPIILSVLMLGVVLLLVVKIIPMFQEVLESLGGTLPQITLVIMAISNFIGDYIIQILLLFAIIVVVLMSYRKTENGRFFYDRLKFRMPIQKHIYKAVIATNLARNLSILIHSGINIEAAFTMVKAIFTNTYFAKKLDSARRMIEQGETLDKAMESLDLFPWVLIKLFAVAQKTGHLDDVLMKAAHVMDGETNTRLKRLTTVIEPMLIMVLSIIIGIVLLSVVLPVVRIMNAIG